MKPVLLDELDWKFDGDGPRMNTGDDHLYGIDPFPCYHHDLELVEHEIANAMSAFPLDPAPKVYVMAYESNTRTNGWAEDDSAWNDEDDIWVPAQGKIMLSGKRVPIHPAVTRYLVAHEWGHHVEYHMRYEDGADAYDDDWIMEYARKRGMDPSIVTLKYGARLWHRNPKEVFANDFRILRACREQDYWPHPDFGHPLETDQAMQWWRDRGLL